MEARLPSALRILTEMTETDRSKKRETLSWCMYDWAYSAFATVVVSAVLPVYYSQVGNIFAKNEAKKSPA